MIYTEAPGAPPRAYEPDRTELARLRRRQRINARRAEWRAKRVLIDGVLVAPVPQPWHGKAWVYDDYACRCPRCSHAKYASSMATRRRHG